MMVVALKHVGTTAWLSEMLKMSVKTSVSSTAESLSTRPGMLSGPGALHALILLRDLLTLSGDSVITWSPGGGGVFCAVVVLHLFSRSCVACSERKGLIFLILYNTNLQDRAVLSMWSEKFSLSSITTPRFLAFFEGVVFDEQKVKLWWSDGFAETIAVLSSYFFCMEEKVKIWLWEFSFHTAERLGYSALFTLSLYRFFFSILW